MCLESIESPQILQKILSNSNIWRKNKSLSHAVTITPLQGSLACD